MEEIYYYNDVFSQIVLSRMLYQTQNKHTHTNIYTQDDGGLMDFYHDYYKFPLYRDEALAIYEAMGKKSIMSNVSYNPFKWYSGIKKMNKRLEARKIEGNMVGEGMVKGGIIIFGYDGTPKYMYEEQTGSELVIEELLAAVQKVRGDDPAAATTSTTSSSPSEEL